MTSLDNVTVIVAHGAWADGAVVFMSGNAALHANPTFAAAATMKAAAVALVREFAEQGIKDGVQVNSIVPGALMTRAAASEMDDECLAPHGWRRD